jgi:L-lactate dehydrogenase (cytochrome)
VGLVSSLRSTMRFRSPHWRGVDRRLAKGVNVEALRKVARRRLPRGVFDYIDGGAEDEVTLERNSSAFRDLEFRPRVLNDVEVIDPSTTVLDKHLSMPLILAPTGFTRIANSAGELAVARAAERAGVPYTLSSLSNRSIEDVRSVSSGDLWFQVYVWKDKQLLESMLERASRANYSTIVITVDTAVLGRRERDVLRGFTLPPRLGPGTVLDGLAHPAWAWDFARAEPIRFANVIGDSVADGSSAVSLSDFVSNQFDPTLRWSDISWFRDRWEGRIVLKGIQVTEDARIAVDHGVDAIAISNHGGRQLDGAPVPVEMIADVVDGRSRQRRRVL